MYDIGSGNEASLLRGVRCSPSSNRHRALLSIAVVLVSNASLTLGAADSETSPIFGISPKASKKPEHNRVGNISFERFFHPWSSNAEPRRRMTQEQIDQYMILSSEQIHDEIQRLASAHPNLCTLTTAQKSYSLPAAGKDGDCPFDKSAAGCPNYIMTIQDYVSHPPGSESDKLLPEVFLSGCLHGNERVGPTAVTETASLLLEAAECESKPNISLRPKGRTILRDENQHQAWLDEVKAATECRESLWKRGITDVHRKWLARLVSTRRIVIMPTANSLGYFQNTREEGSIDPNRDFPYDLKDSKLCMRTIAGRAINEVFREHMFQLSITFHGGMEAVAYEWGAPSYLNHLSPDHFAQKLIASGYSCFGGSWRGHKNYKTGTMNDVVYYVRGGMEDWAYAGSWDPDRVVPCTPSEFGGYDSEKTVYNNSTLRMFNMLVETSDPKTPAKVDWGTNEDLFDAADTSGNGHISRNIRLSLLAIDVVEPYVSILGVNGVSLGDDVVPLAKSKERSCMDTKAMIIPASSDRAVVEWTVGGAFAIDQTRIFVAKWNDVTSNIDCLKMPDPSDLGPEFTRLDAFEGGKGMFAKGGPHPPPPQFDSGSSPAAFGPLFSSTIDTTEYKQGEKIAVIAMAKVDGDWAKKPDTVAPDVGPQTHVVNARTDPNWRHESAGKIVQGRIEWFSVPLTLVIGEKKDDGVPVPVAERLFDRFADWSESEGVPEDGESKKLVPNYLGGAQVWILSSTILAVLVLSAVCCCLRRNQNRYGKATIVEQTEDDDVEGLNGVGGYSDNDSTPSMRYSDHVDEGENGSDLELSRYTIE